MGSSFETAVYTGDAGANEAYEQLVREAVWEYGVDGYNGTISTSHGYFVATETPMTSPEATDFVYKLDEQNRLNKWGQWAAVPLCDGETSMVERRIKVASPDHASVLAAVKAALPKGAVYSRHQLTDVKLTHGAVYTVRPATARRVWVVRSGFAREDSYDTRAEATKAARELLDRLAEAQSGRTWMHTDMAVQVTVTPELRQEDGTAPSIEMVRPVKRLEATAQIHVVKRAKSRSGWLFGGRAAT